MLESVSPCMRARVTRSRRWYRSIDRDLPVPLSTGEIVSSRDRRFIGKLVLFDEKSYTRLFHNFLFSFFSSFLANWFTSDIDAFPSLSFFPPIYRWGPGKERNPNDERRGSLATLKKTRLITFFYGIRLKSFARAFALLALLAQGSFSPCFYVFSSFPLFSARENSLRHLSQQEKKSKNRRKTWITARKYHNFFQPRLSTAFQFAREFLSKISFVAFRSDRNHFRNEFVDLKSTRDRSRSWNLCNYLSTHVV